MRTPTPDSQPLRVRTWVLALLAIALALGVLAAINQTRPPKPAHLAPLAAPASNPQPPVAPFTLNPPVEPIGPQPLAYLEPGVGPISFYIAKCASCHGEYGSYYYENDILAEERGRIPPEGLLSQVRLMLATNAKIEVELGETQVQALAAYVSTFPDVADTDVAVDGPFVAWTGWSPADGGLSGEVTPEATVTVEVAGQTLPATVVDHHWTVTLNGQVELGQIVVVATLGEKQARLYLDQGTFAIPRASSPE